MLPLLLTLLLLLVCWCLHLGTHACWCMPSHRLECSPLGEQFLSPLKRVAAGRYMGLVSGRVCFVWRMDGLFCLVRPVTMDRLLSGF